MLRFFLQTSSKLYAAIARVRIKLYEKRVLKTHDLGAKTIGVGNITVGGTGKTPLVALIAEILAARGERVCILTRGYGRENPRRRVLVSDGARILASAAEAGDEPFELARKMIGANAAVAVVADRNRVAAAVWARENLGATAFVLDDAFQHLRAGRDLNIVLVDATNPFGAGGAAVLPAGILREPLSGLERADAIVITRANLVDARKISDLKFQITDLCPCAKIFVSRNRLTRLIKLEDFKAPTQMREQSGDEKFGIEKSEYAIQKLKSETSGNRFLAFCALGNPENFFAQLRRDGFDLSAAKSFRDHYRYRPQDIDALEREAGASGAISFLTTVKDAVKLQDLSFKRPCFVVESEPHFDDETGFREMIVNAAVRAENIEPRK